MHGPVATESSAATNPFEPTAYLWGISLAAALGGLLFGYDWVVIGGARQFYEAYFHLGSAALVGWANSCALVGCLLGSLIAGRTADRFGRRRVLLAAALLFAISSVLTGWSYSFAAFIAWRILGGVAIGLSSNVSPLYIAEISPAAIRGRLVSLNQFAIVVGILLAQIVNWMIARPVPADLSPAMALQSWNVLYGWRWMFTVLVAPAAAFAALSIVIPESPRWLLARRREAEAASVLTRIGGARYAASEVQSIEDALRSEAAQGDSSWRALLRPGVRKMLLLGMMLAVLQQWTGINILFNYASEIYRSAGYGANDILLNIVITGGINLVFTMLAIVLVDKIGRRRLMIAGCIGIALSHILCAFAYRAGWRGAAVLVLTLSAIACYALTLAPITWVLISEIFPNRVRSQGVSLAVSMLWIASFALTYTFPILYAGIGAAGVFLGYGAICLLGCVMVSVFVPETKGKSLEEIQFGVRTL
ncbi:MFS transporter, sugar porter (SP) family [Granulicella rosea]|uniref:MFS transporter, sugar porter (SP) family n=1 Tax=Granulicella rosea TaxID=474952 RepID=A0A239MMX1_9BACT|nr:sugar porter family MFS transporter [Granulicella rosea]SNT43603.1 MFS transporter, sugar porter (SP) family [Granulicella rosea]